MSILDRLSILGRRAPTPWPDLPEIEASIAMPAITQGTAMGEVFGLPGNANMPVVTEANALTVSAIYACVNLLSGVVAALPAHIYAINKDGNRSRLHDDPLWWLLNEEFSPRWIASAGWEWLMLSRLFYGDAFAHILRQGSRIIGLRPLHPRFVQVAPYPDGSRLVYRIWPEIWEAKREPIVIDQDDVLHVPGLGFNGIRSMTPLQYSLRTTGSVALATQDYSAQTFANRARPDYALTTDKDLTREQIEDIRSQIDENHGRAAGNGGRPMVLKGGLDVKTLSMTNEDAELLGTRRFQVEEICRVYGVPPFMVGSTEKTTSWGSGVSEMGSAFVRYTLRQHLNAFQNELNRKFFHTASRVIEFDTFELERGDMKGLFDALRVAVGTAGAPGWITPNEARAIIYKNPIPGGDTLFSGVNNAKSADQPVGA